LAGFIALRFLNDPAMAQRHFIALAQGSRSVITRARAFYWEGRALAARGQNGAAQERYAALPAAERARTMPPQPDYELETLAQILEGKRLVHCHSYRQDEICMLLQVADDFGFKVGTLQHILEGYKVADRIAAHGAGASSFSDWFCCSVAAI
jgi:hypothetical protein